ncbi:MAG: ABC transporter ATP-binding protein [Parvibaculales bacterium]
MPQSAPPILRLENASLSFGGKCIFQNISLDLPENQFSCLLGKTGIGKSSLLRCLADILPEQARFQGKIKTQKQGFAWMAQDDLLLPWAKTIKNIVIGAKLRKEQPDYKRAKELLMRLGLSDKQDALPHELSGGERQRVALARTLYEARPIVLMDEPFSRLDALTRRELQLITRKLLREKTVLLVTHDPQEALFMGGDIYIMKSMGIKKIATRSVTKTEDILQELEG